MMPIYLIEPYSAYRPTKKKHWMENLFYCTEDKKIIDLFNLHNDWWMKNDSNPDNIWPLEDEFKQCECGTWYREINFQPHAIKWHEDCYGKPVSYAKTYGFFCDTDIINKIQIIQIDNIDGIFDVYSLFLISENEKKIIKKYIRKICKFKIYKIRYKIGRYCVGNNHKIPTFWKENNNTKCKKNTFKSIG